MGGGARVPPRALVTPAPQIVLEYMHGGSLTEVLGPSVEWSEACLAYVCKCCLSGLASLHRHHMLHRDIKSDNILVDFDGNVRARVWRRCCGDGGDNFVAVPADSVCSCACVYVRAFVCVRARVLVCVCGGGGTTESCAVVRR